MREGVNDVVRQNDNDLVQTPSGYSQANTLFKLRYWASPRWNVNYSLLHTTSSNIPRYDRLTQYRNGNLRYAEWYYGPQDWLMNSLELRHVADNRYFHNVKAIITGQKPKTSRPQNTSEKNK